MAENTTPPIQAVSISGRYLVTVGGLLVLIIAMLASLWVKERRGHQRAEDDVKLLQERLQTASKGISEIMSMGAVARPEPAVRPFLREDHAPVWVTLDGAKRPAYVLPASGGERFGFRPGDVIVVEAGGAGAASAPAAASSPAGLLPESTSPTPSTASNP